MSTDRELLDRALGYPFRESAPEPPDAAPARLPAGHAVVLAFGANASRVVLARKLGTAAAASVMCLEARVSGADTVFSAHVSPYGAIPATLHPSPGVVLTARVLVLDRALLTALDATEPNYEREPLGAPVRVEVPGHGPIVAEAYRSRHGALDLGDGPVSLSAVPARHRTLRAWSQREIHAAVRDRLEPGADLEAFVLAAARDGAVRAARTARMRELGEPARGRRSRG